LLEEAVEGVPPFPFTRSINEGFLACDAEEGVGAIEEGVGALPRTSISVVRARREGAGGGGREVGFGF